MYQQLTFNLIGAQTRYEQLDGKQYLVVPTVAITEGVHTGTEGPLLYEEDEVGKNPTTWNHRPVVIYHPTENGIGVSACSPEIVERQGVGVIYNTDWQQKLKMEAWLDEDKLRRVDNRVLTAIQNGETVEVSTGLYNDVDPTPGVWKGEAYKGIVKNIVPDHLAILYDQKGACSVADGAGLLRNASTDVEAPSYDDVKDQIRSLLKKTPGNGYCYIRDLYPKYAVYENDMGEGCYKIGYKVTKGKVTLVGEPEKVRMLTSYVTANKQVLRDMPIRNAEDQETTTVMHSITQPSVSQLSDVMRRQQLEAALKVRFANGQVDDWAGWVTEIFANSVIYFKDGQLFRLPYTYADDKIQFGQSEPEVVQSTYSTKTGGANQSPYTTNQEQPIMANTAVKPLQNTIHKGANELVNDPAVVGQAAAPANVSDGQARGQGPSRQESVDLMISGGVWGEGDRSFLMGLDDGKFAKVSAAIMKGVNQVVVPYSYEGVKDRSNVHNNNAQLPQGPQAMEAYIQNAPPGIRDVLQDMARTHVEEKKRHIAVITANKNNRFPPQWLEQQGINTLRGMASLAKQTAPAQNQQGGGSFLGQGDAPTIFNNVGQADVTQNANGTGNSGYDVLQLPNWEEEPRATA